MVSIMAQKDLMRTEKPAQAFSFREGTPESGSPLKAEVSVVGASVPRWTNCLSNLQEELSSQHRIQELE